MPETNPLCYLSKIDALSLLSSEVTSFINLFSLFTLRFLASYSTALAASLFRCYVPLSRTYSITIISTITYHRFSVPKQGTTHLYIRTISIFKYTKEDLLFHDVLVTL